VKTEVNHNKVDWYEADEIQQEVY